MGERTKLGLSVPAAALALGVLGDALLRATPWGLNVPIWIGLLAAAVVFLVRSRGIALVGGGRWMILPALFFSFAFAWRDSLTLEIVNLLI